MRFYADEMLGKLARWLRMGGLDVAYRREIPDEELIAEAGKESRIVLTRDTRLIRRLDPENALFISQDHLEDQFKEFRGRFEAELLRAQNLTRCAECNEPLQSIPKSEVKAKVWPYVFDSQENFTRCPHCERIYWRATHVEKILARLARLKEEGKNSNRSRT